MTALAEYQRHIRDLLKNRTVGEPDDPHLKAVARSPELLLLRDIAVWWRELAVNGQCTWTTRLLRQYGTFHSVVESFYCEVKVSSYMERAGEQFLDWLSSHEDPVIASLAQFERAVSKVRQGDPGEYRISWDRNPDDLLACLKSGSPPPPPDPEWRYLVCMLPLRFKILVLFFFVTRKSCRDIRLPIE